jgi:hypothetical protein
MVSEETCSDPGKSGKRQYPLVVAACAVAVVLASLTFFVSNDQPSAPIVDEAIPHVTLHIRVPDTSDNDACVRGKSSK